MILLQLFSLPLPTSAAYCRCGWLARDARIIDHHFRGALPEMMQRSTRGEGKYSSWRYKGALPSSAYLRTSARQYGGGCGHGKYGGVVFGRGFGHQRGPRLLVFCRPRLCQKHACSHFFPSLPRGVTPATTHARASPPLKILGRRPATLCPLASCASSATGAGRRSPHKSANLCRLLVQPSGERSRAGGMYPSLNLPEERLRRRQVPVPPVVSQGVASHT